ncbi:TPR-like protein [Dendrothele bispora CBS 962.96]|uniref:TPR-like protein n=1 Tax=Dendrothele bispora (strain CBS 962.96) TaxID=1314807 RepID=A0A4S8LRA3_DENBC|nr:TPR-like protein [Dendrothele bispora CBS 962.96]
MHSILRILARTHASRSLLRSRPSSFLGPATLRRYATSTTPHSSAVDPGEQEALKCLEQGTLLLEAGDVNGAKDMYKRSVEIHRNASALYNLGVTFYHLKDFDQAIAAWKESIELQPSSPDAHTNLASAYIISPLPRPDLALHHLQHVHTLHPPIAAKLAPKDPEIAFNLAAVLEATGRLEEALEQYKRSEAYGVDRATAHIRNVSAKILSKRAQENSGDKKD